MTDPSFPQEWREKGLEYKELKKLINGVVAELEGLGLGADVLRELLEPPEQAAANAGGNDTAAGPRQTESTPTSYGKTSTDTKASSSSSRPSSAGSSTDRRARSESRSSQGSDADSDSASDAVNGSLVAGLARLSTGRQASSAFIDPLSPLMEEEEARRRSVEKSMNVPPLKNDMPAPLMGQVMSANPAGGQSSAAGEWLAHVSRHNGTHRKRRGSSKRTPSSGGVSASGESNGESSREASAQPESSSLLAPQGDNTKFLRASPMTMLGIRQSRDDSQERESSAEAESGRATSPSSQWRLGRKDLEQLRRNSHSNLQRPTPPSPNSLKRRASSGLSSKPEVVASDDQPHDWDGHAWRERQSLGWDSPRGSKKRTTATSQSTAQANPVRWVQGKDGRRARAEYELGGTPHHPIPKIKLIIESPINSDDEAGDSDQDDDDDDDGRIVELPPSQPGSRRPSADLSAQNEQPDANAAANSGSHTPRLMRTREIVIPLTADTEFLDTLTASLGKLSELQHSQRDTFVTSTEDLCASVARAASPYASKNDLYVWREIFQLWVDMQIFESQREKDRGELSVDESEARLKRFAAELAKRGWLAENVDPTSLSPGGTKLARSKTAMQGALTVPMKDSRSTSAVEDFLRLNLALLDVKKFQRVNVEAARKILKKHDKRTALTASTGLRSFVQQQEYARMSGMGASAAAAAMMSSMGMGMPAESTGTLVAPAHGTHPSLAALLPSSTTGLLSESLPHILLSLLTTTLLPMLPSVDDYSCAICTGLAWRPIRLDCSHLFCIRCLVKLQKQGKKDCPLCRAPDVVKTADGRNMDPATVNMLKMWFPHEVDEKEHENDSDRKKEELAELGLEQKKCVIM